MDTVINRDFHTYYGLSGMMPISVHTDAGRIAFHDAKACNACIRNSCDVCSGQNREENFIVACAHPINIANNESFLEQMTPDPEKCDLMLYDNDKVVFVDMFCRQEKYVHPFVNMKGPQQGKLAKVRSQITNTIQLLSAVPSINNKFAGLKEKHGVFGCRLKQQNSSADNVAGNMGAFMAMPIAASVGRYTPLVDGFMFTTKYYPDPYKW